MLAAERRQRIIDILKSRQYVESEELADELNTSLETIRRDLAKLEATGELLRVRGGASQTPNPTEAGYQERSRLATTEKLAMARVAISLVRPGMTLMLDVGTSCLSAARALPHNWSGRIVTCSLPVAVELADRPGVEVLVAGGRVRPGDLALSNVQTVSFFERIRPDLAFLGSGGLDADAGLTDYHSDEVDTRRIVLHNASQSYVLADSSKHGRIAPFAVCQLGELSGVITDRLEDNALQSALLRVGVRVLTENAV